MRGTTVARPDLTAALSTPTVLFVLVAAGYVAGYQLSSEVFSAEGQNASFFPPAGVTLAALVLVERSRWPIVLAAAASSELVLDLVNGIGAASLGYVLANVAEPLAGALLLITLVGRVDLRRTRHLAAFLGAAVVVAPVVGASIAATTFVHVAGNEGWARFAFEWWSGDGLAVLVVGAALVSLRAYTRLSTRRLVEAVVIASLAVAATASVFLLGWFPFVYVPVALLVVLAFRAGTTAVAVTSALVAFVAAGATAEADDFWASVDVTPANRILYLQLALAVIVAAVLALAAEIAQRERIARRLARSEAEHEAARAARARAELLESHVGRLSSAVTEADVARATVTSLEELGADAAVVHALRSSHLEPLGAVLPPRLGSLARIPLDAVSPAADAVRTGSVVAVSAEELAARYPGHALAGVGPADVWPEVGSIVSVPLSSAARRPIGVMTMLADSPDWFDADRRAVVRELAEQCGLAIERAVLQAAAEAAAEDAALLAHLGEVLERPIGAHDRARALVRALTAARPLLAIVHDADGDELSLVAEESSLSGRSGADRVVLERLAHEAFSSGRHAGTTIADLDVLAVPLRARDRSLGVLTLGADRSGPARLTPVLLQRISTRAALALDNALLYEHERDVSHSLQLGLLGQDIVDAPGTSIATAYRPGTAALEVGGDWHDAFLLPDGRLALVVGDVVGHGLEAAIAMGQLRGAVRALAPLGSPREVVMRLDALVDTLPEAGMATLAYAVLDTRSGEFTYACAGHPPPLMVPRQEPPRLLWEGRTSPLGSFSGSVGEEASERLELGDTLVLYTDGLVERRTEGIGEGLERLVERAGDAAPKAPQELVDHLLQACLVEEEQEDDVCVLAVRRTDA